MNNIIESVEYWTEVYDRREQFDELDRDLYMDLAFQDLMDGLADLEGVTR